MVREVELIRSHLVRQKIHIDAKVIQNAIMMKKDVESNGLEGMPKVVDTLMENKQPPIKEEKVLQKGKKGKKLMRQPVATVKE